MAELAYAQVSETCAERLVGSNPTFRTHFAFMKNQGTPTASNRQAHRIYTFEESLEAGLQLKGTEVKSLREGKCNLKDGFARFDKGELILYNVHISPYEKGNIYNQDPTRSRKLLLHKKQLKRFYGLLTQKGRTIIPLKIYFKHGIAKCEIAVGKSKKQYDHRREIKKRIAQREVDRAIKYRKK